MASEASRDVRASDYERSQPRGNGCGGVWANYRHHAVLPSLACEYVPCPAARGTSQGQTRLSVAIEASVHPKHDYGLCQSHCSVLVARDEDLGYDCDAHPGGESRKGDDGRRGPGIDGNRQESESSGFEGLESAVIEGNGGGHGHASHSRRVVIEDGDDLPFPDVAAPSSPFSRVSFLSSPSLKA